MVFLLFLWPTLEDNYVITGTVENVAEIIEDQMVENSKKSYQQY